MTSDAAKIPPGVFVHQAGLCESDRVGAGTRVWAFAHVLSGAVVGRDCNICDGAYVETGAVIGDRVTVKNQVLVFAGVTVEDDVFLGPGAVFTNDLRPRAHVKDFTLAPIRVRTGATIGAAAVIVAGVAIGEHAFVGAGTVVARDVPAHGFVVGNPGKRIGWVCVCGHRLADDLRCIHCSRSYAADPSDAALGGLREVAPADTRAVSTVPDETG